MRAIIGIFEFKVLSSLNCIGSAHTSEIQEDLTRWLREKVSNSATSTCLDRMEKKGLVASMKCIPIGSKNKMIKRNYRMTDSGKDELLAFQETVKLLSKC